MNKTDAEASDRPGPRFPERNPSRRRSPGHLRPYRRWHTGTPGESFRPGSQGPGLVSPIVLTRTRSPVPHRGDDSGKSAPPYADASPRRLRGLQEIPASATTEPGLRGRPGGGDGEPERYTDRCKGATIKRIRRSGRDLADIFPYAVVLSLRVRVQPDWKKNEKLLKKLYF